MRIYIPGIYRAAVMMLKRGADADYEREKAITAKHAEIASRIFDGITTGIISEAHQTTPHSLTIYHRSTREGIPIQCSHFLRMTTSDAFYAISHRDIYKPHDINLSPARYITLTEGAKEPC